MSEELLVDVAVPIYNGLHLARRCIDSLVRYSTGPFRIHLVDDGSDSHTARTLDEWASQHGPVSTLHNPRNLGFVRSCNRVLGTSDADLVVLVNSDTAVAPRWLDKFRRCFTSDPSIGVASPISNFAPHLRLTPLPGCDHLSMNALIERFSERRYPDVTTPEGFCYAISRRCLDTIGVFDPLFDRGYGEESDLALRANYHGLRTVCVDDTYVYHRGRGTFGQATRDELYHRNKVIFHDRWGARFREQHDAFKRADVLGYLRERLNRLRPDAYEYAFRER